MAYYVISDDNCLYDGMTKEQIIAAIQQGLEQGYVSDPDGAVISKIKEMNANGALQMWVGTEAEYNALSEKGLTTVYIVTAAGGGFTLYYGSVVLRSAAVAHAESHRTGGADEITPEDIGAAALPSLLTTLPASGTALTNNAEYRVGTEVGTYTFAWPSSPFEVWVKFTVADSFNITFPAGTTYIGGAPSFTAGSTYEMSVKDGVIICQEVTAE